MKYRGMRLAKGQSTASRLFGSRSPAWVGSTGFVYTTQCVVHINCINVKPLRRTTNEVISSIARQFGSISFFLLLLNHGN